jgi:hypothetical protein
MLYIDLFQYLKLARSQKFYSYLQFKPCEMDFPESNSNVIINIGGYELNFKLIGTQVAYRLYMYIIQPFRHPFEVLANNNLGISNTVLFY